MKFTRIGAVLYVVWGLLHIQAALDEFSIGSGLTHGIVQGKINQGAWDLLFFAIFSIVIAIRYIWNNKPIGYWLNLIVVSTADIGFIIFVLLPGNTAVFPSILGPVFWIAAVVFTTLGIRANKSA